ncbi:MAG: protein-disulfide reductase DsbD [Campylobacteraceae bacterium]|nr:protein-disulfide reductase DsbD [Campylobacteraceae bacterium]
MLAFGFLNAEPVDVSKAFDVKASMSSGGANFEFSLDETVFLYADKLKVSIDGNEITKLLNLPPEVTHKTHQVYAKDFTLFVPSGLILSSANLEDFTVNLEYLGCAYDGFCYNPQNFNYKFTNSNGTYLISKTEHVSKAVSNVAESLDAVSEQDSISSKMQNSSFFVVLITFFGYGLLLALTPCVFPMIPILSSIIVAKCGEGTNTKKSFFISFIYVFAMALAYALAGVLASFFGGSIQGMLQIPWVITLFSLVFVALAFSMFGFYQLQLPASLQSKISKKGESKSGLGGVFVMGFLSALIVGPCVAAPLAGALLYIAQTGDAFLGGLSLFVMSFGMGVPLLLIGLGAGKFMPKPGAWMDEISKIFGFIMLFMAVWMMSRIMSPNLALLLYGILGVFFGAFLLPSSDDGLKKFKLGSSLVVLIYSAILIVGFASGGTKVSKPLAGFGISSGAIQSVENEFKYVSNLAQLEKVVATSQKPVLIDFWATWCVNCKEIDAILESAELSSALAKFELIKIDVTKNSVDDRELMQRFGVYGPPSLVFFKDGVELKGEQTISISSVSGFKEKLERIAG